MWIPWLLAPIIQVPTHRSMYRQFKPSIRRNLPFTPQVNFHTGPVRETPIAVLPGQGANMVYSTHPPNPHP